MITFLDTLLQSTALKSSGPACIDYLFVKVRVIIRVKVRVIIRVKVRVLKIRNNDIRNQKQKRKIILLARDHCSYEVTHSVVLSYCAIRFYTSHCFVFLLTS